MTYQCEGCYQSFSERENCLTHMRTCRVVRDIIVEEKLALQERESRGRGYYFRGIDPAVMAETQAESDPLLQRYRSSRTYDDPGYRVGEQEGGINGIVVFDQTSRRSSFGRARRCQR